MKNHEIEFIHGKTTELNPVVEKIIYILWNPFDLRGSCKINSINKNSEKILFNNCENKKSLFHWLEVLEKKICWWEIHGRKWKVCVKHFFGYRFPWLNFSAHPFDRTKNPWKLIESIWNQSNSILSIENSGSWFQKSRIHGNCLHYWWNKNQSHFTDGNAREPILSKSNAKKMVSLKENPWNWI